MMKVMGDGNYPKLEKPGLTFTQKDKIPSFRRNTFFNEEYGVEAGDS
jgi:hypothetical protein